ncbi:MAG: cytochrome c [Melioribacteraceae bacterium]|nr:cytochrome c [Melioribacteraceae bacterium]
MGKGKIEAEMKYRELLNNPIRLFGFAFPYFFVIILLAGIFYVKNLDTISFNSIPISYIDSLNIDRDIEQKRGGIMPAVELNRVLNPTEEMIRKGKELYDANCQSCHGSGGKGDGPAGVAMNPNPRNFLDTNGWTIGRTFPDLYKTLQEGIIKNGMAAYEYMPPSDRIDIILYLRTFTDFPEITNDQLSQLDATYNLSAGATMPNQIPVKKSVKILVSEFNGSDTFSELLFYIKSDGSQVGARLLNEYSYSPERIAGQVLKGEISMRLDEFIKTVSHDPLASGFKTSVVSLSKSEWNELHKFLLESRNLRKS